MVPAIVEKVARHFFELGCTKFSPRCRRHKLRIARIRTNPDARSLRCSSSYFRKKIPGRTERSGIFLVP